MLRHGSGEMSAQGGFEEPAPQILVADDEPAIRSLMIRALRLDNLHAQPVSSGVEALQALGSGCFDLMVLDYKLSDLNASQVIEEMEALPAAKRTPIVLVTGRISYTSDPIDTPHIKDVLTKPFALEVFRNTVAKVLRREG